MGESPMARIAMFMARYGERRLERSATLKLLAYSRTDNETPGELMLDQICKRLAGVGSMACMFAALRAAIRAL